MPDPIILFTSVEAKPLRAPVARAGNTVPVRIGIAFAANPASNGKNPPVTYKLWLI